METDVVINACRNKRAISEHDLASIVYVEGKTLSCG